MNPTARIAAMLLAQLALTASVHDGASVTSVGTDGLGLPRIPSAHLYAAAGTETSYVVARDIEAIVGFLRAHATFDSFGGIVRHGRKRTAVLTLRGSRGDYDVVVTQEDGYNAFVMETLQLSLVAEMRAFFDGGRVHDPTGPLGIPLYPHRIFGKLEAVVSDGHGFVSYVTTDDFPAVERYFERVLPNTYTRSYGSSGGESRFQTFHAGTRTVTVMRTPAMHGLTSIAERVDSP